MSLEGKDITLQPSRFSMSLRALLNKRLLYSQIANKKWYSSVSGPNLEADISHYALKVPSVSGAGPFAEKVQFQSVDNLLSISIPGTAVFNTSQGNIVSASGPELYIRSDVDLKSPLTELASSGHILSQQISADTSASVLVASSTPSNSYIILKTDKTGDADWYVYKRDSIVAWTRDVSVQGDGETTVIKCTGNDGQLVLNGSGPIKLVQLAENESMMASSSHLIAVQSSSLQSIKSDHVIQEPTETGTSWLDHIKTRAQHWIIWFSARKPDDSIVLQGPCNVLVQSNAT